MGTGRRRLLRRSELAGSVAVAALALGTVGGPASGSTAAFAPAARAAAGPATGAGAGAAGAAAGPAATSGTGPAAAATRARAATRLAISAAPARGGAGSRLLVVAKLTRAWSGAPLRGRVVLVHTQRLGSERWVLAARLRTDGRGRVVHRGPLSADTQVTARFAGDTGYGPAAALTLTLDVRPYAARLDPPLASAVADARAAARRAGVTLRINSGYRTWSEQLGMYRAAVRRYGSPAKARAWVLPPQESHHVTGRAVDLGPPGAAGWLAARSARYGLCRPYANEPWHFEYRPAWIDRAGGRCPAPAARPGDPGPFDPAPRVRAYPGSTR